VFGGGLGVFRVFEDDGRPFRGLLGVRGGYRVFKVIIGRLEVIIGCLEVVIE